MSAKKVTIVDYGVGNLFSIRGALDYCGAETTFATSPEEIAAADRLLLPGVGAFGDSVADIHANGLAEPLRRFVERDRPLLGICLGMQMLLSRSEEFGLYDGLDLIPGTVTAIPPEGTDGKPHPIPHVGWSALFHGTGGDWSNSVLSDAAEGDSFYFVHSFHAVTDNPAHQLAVCDYHGHKLGAAVQRNYVIGCQFHPEKSATGGLQIMRNYLAL